MKIYAPNEKNFITNGLGYILPIKCIEKKGKSLNGWSIDVEVSVEHMYLIQQDNIAYVETKEKDGQPFRINNIKKEKRVISFTANHIAFDCERYMLDDVRPTNLSSVSYLNYINSRTDTPTPFIFSSNIDKSATNYFIRKNLLEALVTAEETFNGIYDIDGFNITLKDHIGNDNGYTVVYGKNLSNVTVDEDWSAVCTKILPEGPDELLLPERYLMSDTQYVIPFTKTIKFEIEKEKSNGELKTETELITELRKVAKDYLEENKYPKISYVITSNPEEDVCIGDIVHIKHPLVTIAAEIQSYEYDVISKKMKVIEFGNYHRDVKQIFNQIKDKINQTLEATTLNRQMIQHQTDMINSQHKNGYIYIDDNEIFILDKLPKEDAKNVWRWNMGGLGFSSNGYQGPFETAITNDGVINANFITAGSISGIELSGNTIKGGSITGDTTINVGTDLYVGDYIYLGKDGDSFKKISFNEKSNIYFFKDSIYVYNGEFLKQGGNIQVGDDRAGVALYSNGKTIASLHMSRLEQASYGGNCSLESVFEIDIRSDRGLVLDAAEGIDCHGMLTVWDKIKVYESSTFDDVTVMGDLFVTGTKNRIVTTNFGDIKMNAVESADCRFTDEGQITLDEDGKGTIFFDAIWLETVNTELPYHIQLTPYCEVCPWIVEECQDKCIIAGKPNTKVNWHVSAIQKGYENARLEKFERG